MIEGRKYLFNIFTKPTFSTEMRLMIDIVIDLTAWKKQVWTVKTWEIEIEIERETERKMNNFLFHVTIYKKAEVQRNRRNVFNR